MLFVYTCNYNLIINLRSGPILAVLIHSLSRLPLKLVSFRLARRNVITKRNENLSLISGYLIISFFTSPKEEPVLEVQFPVASSYQGETENTLNRSFAPLYPLSQVLSSLQDEMRCYGRHSC